jgi:hypothetical protein
MYGKLAVDTREPMPIPAGCTGNVRGRAAWHERTVVRERAAVHERTVHGERAGLRERTVKLERAVLQERAVAGERAGNAERTVLHERAGGHGACCGRRFPNALNRFVLIRLLNRFVLIQAAEFFACAGSCCRPANALRKASSSSASRTFPHRPASRKCAPSRSSSTARLSGSSGSAILNTSRS